MAFGGRKLNKAECNYSTTEKECLAVIEALKGRICLDVSLTCSLIMSL